MSTYTPLVKACQWNNPFILTAVRIPSALTCRVGGTLCLWPLSEVQNNNIGHVAPMHSAITIRHSRASHQVPSLWRRLSSLSMASTMVRMAVKVESRDFSALSR